jgi:hypothetical protein
VSDACELVYHLLLLEGELLGVGEVLPLAAATHAKVGAERLGAQGRELQVFGNVALHVAATFGAYLYVYQIAGYGHRYEYHNVVPFAHSVAFGSQSSYA